MEDYSVPLMGESSSYSSASGSGSGASSHNHNNHNHQQHHQHHQHHNQTHTTHHHKDYMLGTGNTPAVAVVVATTASSSSTNYHYELPNTKAVIATATASIKSDYAAFANCIQQSALLDHRDAVDGGGDGGVGGVGDATYKTLTLMGGDSGNAQQHHNNEATNLQVGALTDPVQQPQQQQQQQQQRIVCPTTSANSANSATNAYSTQLLFDRENMDAIDSAVAVDYLTLKSAADSVGGGSVAGAAGGDTAHYLQTMSDAQHCQTTAASSLLGYSSIISSGGGNHNQSQNQQHSHIITSHLSNHSNNRTKAHLTCPASNSDATTDAGSTSTAPASTASSLHASRYHLSESVFTVIPLMEPPRNNRRHDGREADCDSSASDLNRRLQLNHTPQQQSQPATQPQTGALPQPSNASATDENQITTTTASIASSAESVRGSTRGNGGAGGSIIVSHVTINSRTSSSVHSIEELVASACSAQDNQSTNDAHVHSAAAAPAPASAPKESLEHQVILNLSSDDCDSMSSSDEYNELDTCERSGYQDNTSSHSHQSANGGAGSSGGGGANAAANAVTNVALLNGVGGNPNAPGGSAGGGGGGGYMSLLPPAVGSASSSGGGGHMGGGGGVAGSLGGVAVGGNVGGVGSGMGGTSVSAGGSGEGIDFKHLFEELCPVCGDKVSGYHYGLLTCESCKGFFKRTVQNKKVYTCVAERSCHIDKTQRKRCPYCRFQKCLEVGMKLEAVRADRMRGGRNKFGPMYKRDRARKLQVMRQRQLALQALRTSIGSADMKSTPLSPVYQQAYPNMNIKQEIQIPQVSSLTQSPDSSPSPIAIALGQVNASTGVIATPMNGNNGAGGGGGNNNNTNSGNTTSDGLNRGNNSSCHDVGTGSLHNTAESKLCFDSGTHPSSTADSIIEPLRVSPMIRDFVQSIDDREWQTQLFALLQKQTYNQVEVDLFELMCKVLDQNLFSQVDWARNTVFFKDLKVDDQMKLLQHSWSDMLVLDHLHQRIHNGLPDETQLNNGQVFNLLGLGLLGVPQLSDYFNELQNKLQDLKFDMGDYVCMKFLILLNPDVRGIINKKTVLEGHENVQAALLDYTLTCYPSVTDKFRRLLNILPEIHAMASRGEEHLYSKHCAGSAPTQTLLMEMLHAKRKV